MPPGPLRKPVPPPELQYDQAREMLDELVAAFSDPDFQWKLAVMYTTYSGKDDLETRNLVNVRRDLCFPIQTRILPKYGFEASQAGVLRSHAAFLSPLVADDPELGYKATLCTYLIHENPKTEFWVRAVRDALAGGHPLPSGDPERNELLAKLESDGEALAKATQAMRSDPDVVLTVVAKSPKALRHAYSALLSDRTFAIEAVMRNKKALKYLPAWEENEAVLAARDGARPGHYVPWECLRLVGHFNEWRTTDSCLRMRHAAGNPWRLSLRVRLSGSGCVSFQVVSASRGYALRVFPSANARGRDGFFRLPATGADVDAECGGESEGHNRNFFVEEEPCSVVTIHVELQERSSYASVWCEAARGDAAAGEEEPIILPQAAGWQGAQFSLPKSAGEVCVLDAVEKMSDFDDLAREAFRLSERYLQDSGQEGGSRASNQVRQAMSYSRHYFGEQLDVAAITRGRSLALLVDSSYVKPFGYCMYSVEDEDQRHLWLQHIVILEAHRRKGLGSLLIHWLSTRACGAGCASILLNSTGSAVPFYRSLGFSPCKDRPGSAMQLFVRPGAGPQP